MVRAATWRTVTVSESVSNRAFSPLKACTSTFAVPFFNAMNFDTAIVPFAGWFSPESAVVVMTRESAAVLGVNFRYVPDCPSPRRSFTVALVNTVSPKLHAESALDVSASLSDCVTRTTAVSAQRAPAKQYG